MGKRPTARGKKAAVSADIIIKAIRESGIMKLDPSIEDLTKRIAEIERKSGGAYITVVYDKDKYGFMLK
jgi:hypothetical protein